MTQVVVTSGAVRSAKLQSNCHHQQTNTQLFTGRMPFLFPSKQCQTTGGKSITFHGLAHPKLICWGRSIVVRTLVSAGELSLSCARLLAGWVTTLC